MSFQRQMDYVDVATRLAEMREKFPELTMSQVKMEFVVVNGMEWVVYTAAAYRTPDDIRPGIGTAWEPIPGPTNFTRDSEVQNAETAAWGRALIAIGASTKHGIASLEEVGNRSEHTGPVQNAPRGPQKAPTAEIERILAAAEQDPSNTFLASLAKQWSEKNSLSAKQIESGLTAAGRVLDQPRVPVTPAGDEWPPEDERF